MIELPEKKKESKFTSEVLFPEKIGKVKSIIEKLNDIKYPVRYGYYVQKNGENEFLIRGARLSIFLFLKFKNPIFSEVASINLEEFEGKTKILFEYKGENSSLGYDSTKRQAESIFKKIANSIYSRI